MTQTTATVLVVDDDPLDAAVLSTILSADYRVLVATDPDAALRVLRSDPPPDLVLLDVLMEGVDGLDLCRRIKTDGALSRIPIIFVTARDRAADEVAGFAAGAVDYIVKPVNASLVQARVRTHLDLRRARDELERQNELLMENARLREEVEQITRHDLKNPLMIVLNFSSLISGQSNISAQQRGWLQAIEDAGRRMLDTINRSVDIYRMERGTYVAKAEPLDILQILRHIATALTPLARQKGVEISLLLNGAPPGHAERWEVAGEESLAYSMLLNLIKNAVEAAPRDSAVSIAIDGKEGAAVIRIHNQGAIPPAIRPRFFEKYATWGKDGGTGLGAYSAMLMAKTLGGAIDAATSEETGTTVTVTLRAPH